MTWKAIVLTCFMSSAAWADKVYVEAVKGSGIPESDRESVQELIRIAVPDSGNHTVTSKAEDAEVTLSPTLMKLGDSYVLTIQKKNKSGQTVFGEKMKAALMSEMDTVAARLTRSVMTHTAVSNTADVTNVTREEETMNTRRYNATRQWVIGFGPGWTGNTRSSGGGFTFLLGFLWGLDPDFSVNLSLNTNSGRENDDSSFTDFSLGGEYYFTRTKYAPFVGGRLGWGSARTNDNCNVLSIGCTQDRASGWSATVTAGYKMFRTSTVNMAILGSYSYIFDRTSLGNPSLGTVQIAVYF